MTVSYFVRYDVAAFDANGFLEFYRKKHVPILTRWPGMRRVVLHTGLKTNEPFPVNEGRTFLLAQLEFETQADLEAALQSPQRAEARLDFGNFPPFEGTVTHQAMTSDEAWRRKS